MMVSPALMKAGISLLLIVGVGVGAWTAVRAYNAAIEGKAQAEERAAALKDDLDNRDVAIAKLQEMGRLADVYASDAREAERRERAQRLEFERKLNAAAAAAAVAGDPTARDWLAAPVPPLIRGMRRAERESASRDAVPGPDGKAQPDAGAPPARRDERATPQRDRRGERVVVGPQVVQP